MKSPCYNDQTKTDCLKRKSGCAATCPEWSDYAKCRNSEYDKKTLEKDALVNSAGKEKRLTNHLKIHKRGFQRKTKIGY